MDFIDLRTQYERIRADVTQRMQAVLDRGSYINGPEVGELEQQLAAYVGVRHAVAVSSGTDALLMALMALGVGRGDEVVTSPFTFAATVETIALLGATPVFVDIRPDTYNLSASLLEAAIGPRTRAIMPVSLYGQCAELDEIGTIAERHGLPVIEDAAQSFGASYQGRRSCAWTTIACTSFYPAKPLGCYGDGGACFTDDDALAGALRRIRDHGQEGRYHHTSLGVNGRLDTLQAAVLLAKLSIFPDEVAARGRIGARYTHEFAVRAPGLRTPQLVAQATSVYAQYTIEVPQRAVVQQQLTAAGVPTAVHYPTPLHRQPAYAGLISGTLSLPVAERAAARVLSLPMHPYLDTVDQDRVVAALAGILAQLPEPHEERGVPA